MVSIIVPIYKVEKYLRKCVDSILNSTYQDFELILVDDGSPDGCGAICDEYASREQRIKVVHKTNGGLPDARNAGIKVATGDYLWFVDSDDFVHPSMLETLYNAVISGNYDFSMVGIKHILEGENFEMPPRVDVSHHQVISRSEFMRGLYNENAATYDVAWNKLYKRSLVKDMLFSLLKGAEDVEWNHRVCIRMNQAIKIDADLYYYLQRSTSLMHQGFSRNHIDRIRSYQCCLSQIPDSEHEFKSLCLNQLYKVMIFTRHNAGKTEYAAEANALCADVYKHTAHDLMHSGLRWNQKLKNLIFYHYPGLYSAFMKACDIVS